MDPWQYSEVFASLLKVCMLLDLVDVGSNLEHFLIRLCLFLDF